MQSDRLSRTPLVVALLVLLALVAGAPGLDVGATDASASDAISVSGATGASDAPSDAGPVLTARLQRALADPAFGGRDTGGTLAVWVFFTDKGLVGAALQQAFDRAEAELTERAAWRRSKVTVGRRLVDGDDLPVAIDYVAAVGQLGAVPRQESRWLNAASFDATDAQVRAMARLPFVRRVDLVLKMRRPDLPVDPSAAAMMRELGAEAARDNLWNIDYGGSLAGLVQINVPPVHEMGITGAGVIVGMLDTGFKTTHEALVGVPVIAVYDFINDDDVVENEPGDPASAHNHGTKTMSTCLGFYAGELVGTAFGASAILAKTEDVADEQPIEEDWWVAGLEWAEGLGADVISSSLGYYAWYEFEDLDGNTAVTTIAADLAVGRGVVVVNSAGNQRGSSSFPYIITPADGDSVIAVGAVDLEDDYASFSSPGPTADGRIKPDVAALGVHDYVVDPSDDHGYGTASGTSFSCPLTAGVAALILSRVPSLTPIQVREALRMTADRADAPDNDFGWGILDAYAAVTYFGAVIVHDPLEDTQDTDGPYPIICTMTDRVALLPDQLFVHYRTDAGSWTALPLVPAGQDLFTASIAGQPAGTTIDYYLTATDELGVTSALPPFAPETFFTFAVESDLTAVGPLPARGFDLAANYPNPFNPSTQIRFDLARAAQVKLTIFDLHGRLVRRLLDEQRAAGSHEVRWDGRNDAGRDMPSDSYLYRLNVDGMAAQRKMLLLR